MDRLTRRIRSGEADCAYCNNEYEGADNHCSNNCSVKRAQMEKLAKYEDLEEQGLLLKLPCSAAVDFGYLYDWYIASVDDGEPVWTEAHLRELCGDFILIPKSLLQKGEQHG